MKKIIQHSLLLMVVVLVMASCGNKTPQESKLIPKDASAVLVFDNKSMREKLKKGNIELDSVIQKFMNSTGASEKDKQRFKEIKDAGVDLENNIYFFSVQKGGSPLKGGATNVFNLMGTLKDASKFEAFLKKEVSLENKTIEKAKGYSFLVFEREAMVSWTDKNVLLTLYTKYESPEFDTVTNTFKYPDGSATKSEMKKEVERYYSLKENESLASVKVFTDMFKEKGDIYGFSSSNSSLAMLGALPFQPPKLEELLKDNFSTTVVNFEDGKAVAKNKAYPNKMLSALIDKYGGKTLKTELLENYPSQNVNALLAASFNPEIINGLLKELDLETMANSFLSKQGISTGDIVKAFKGDIAAAFSDFVIMPEERMPTYKFLVNLPLADKASFDKIAAKLVETRMVVNNGGKYTLNPEMAANAPFYLYADDKNLIIANNEATYTEYAAGKTKIGVSKDVFSDFSGKSGGFYIDFDKIIQGVASVVRGNQEKIVYDIVSGVFKDGIATSDKLSGNKMESEMELRFKDTKQNSLVTLANMFIKIGNDLQAYDKQHANDNYGYPDVAVDTAAAVPVPSK